MPHRETQVRRRGSVSEHGVDGRARELCESCDLGFRQASFERLRDQGAERFALLLGLRARRESSLAVSCEGVANLIRHRRIVLDNHQPA